MKQKMHHYTECGLNNIYLVNGYRTLNTSRGEAISIHNIDGLHRAIGLCLVTSKKELSNEDIRFLRHEMLLSQNTLGKLLGVGEQAIHRWENGKTSIPKPSEFLLRLLFREHAVDQTGNISNLLKRIANLEETMNEAQLLFKDTKNGWQAAA